MNKTRFVCFRDSKQNITEVEQKMKNKKQILVDFIDYTAKTNENYDWINI